MKVLSLFSGCGGLDYGFSEHDAFDICKSVDFSKDAVDTYNLNFKHKADLCDVERLELAFHPDVIIGGAPCQDFSAAGNRTLGNRAGLTETFATIICSYKPKYFVMENVPAIQTTGRTIYNRILTKFKSESYGLTCKVIFMPDYGIPQARKRLIIIGILGGVDGELSAPLDCAKEPVANIREYIKRHGDIGLNGLHHIYRHPRNYTRRGVYSIDELYPTVRGVIRSMPHTKEFHKDDSCKTREDIVNPNWLIMSKIQTFPNSFQWLNKNNSTIVGNAVPPRFSAVLAKCIADHSVLM